MSDASWYSSVVARLGIVTALLCGIRAEASDSWAEKFHFGLDLSFLRLDTSHASELNKNGFAVAAKGGLLDQGKEWELESGLGFRYEALSGSQLNVTRKLRFSSAVFDLHARYRLTDAFSMGPMLQVMFGTDMSHTEIPKGASSTLTMLGLSGRVRVKEAPVSLTLNALVDVNLSKQVLWGIGLGVMFHFPRLDSSLAPTPPGTSAATYRTPRPQVEYRDNHILVRLPEDVLLFPTAVYDLNATQKNYLFRLGEVLVSRDREWKKLIVIGHTDFLGSDEYNDDLSRNRAQAVKNALGQSGIPSARIAAVGRGKREPLTWDGDAESLSRNRRVEIKIEGVKANSNIGKMLQSIDPEYRD